MEIDIKKIFLWIMIVIIIIITLLLCLIYLISKTFRSYPCYLNIILSFSILIDNLLRLIPLNNEENKEDEINKNPSFLCYFQAISLAAFDKLMLTVITVNAYLTYIGFTMNEFYKNHIKELFIASISVALLISISLALIFTIQSKPIPYENVCYVKATVFKETTDAAVTAILAGINFFCIVNLLIHIANIIKEIAVNKNKNDYIRHYYRIILSLFISAATFLIVILIIADSLFVDDNFIDLCYIIDALVVDLFYTCNRTVINEIKKLFGLNPDEVDVGEGSFSSDNNDRSNSLTED